MAEFMRESIVLPCRTSYVYDVVGKRFTFAISSSDELLVLALHVYLAIIMQCGVLRSIQNVDFTYFRKRFQTL